MREGVYVCLLFSVYIVFVQAYTNYNIHSCAKEWQHCENSARLRKDAKRLKIVLERNKIVTFMFADYYISVCFRLFRIVL